MLCISLQLLIFRYSAQILLENALFCRQNARPQNSLILLEILPAEFIQAYMIPFNSFFDVAENATDGLIRKYKPAAGIKHV